MLAAGHVGREEMASLGWIPSLPMSAGNLTTAEATELQVGNVQPSEHQWGTTAPCCVLLTQTAGTAPPLY